MSYKKLKPQAGLEPDNCPARKQSLQTLHLKGLDSRMQTDDDKVMAVQSTAHNHKLPR